MSNSLYVEHVYDTQIKCLEWMTKNDVKESCRVNCPWPRWRLYDHLQTRNLLIWVHPLQHLTALRSYMVRSYWSCYHSPRNFMKQYWNNHTMSTDGGHPWSISIWKYLEVIWSDESRWCKILRGMLAFSAWSLTNPPRKLKFQGWLRKLEKEKEGKTKTAEQAPKKIEGNIQ